MTTFPCFASSFDFFNNPSVLDVADIIVDFRARVTGQSPAWTEPVADSFKSPVDGVGRFFTVALTAVSGTRLGMIVTDQNAITIADRSIDITGAGTSINYYTGQFHAWIEALEATVEILQAGILDETPLDQDAILNYVWAQGYRNAGGGVDGGGGTMNVIQMLDNGSIANANRFRSYGQTQAAVIGLKDAAGNLQYFPCDTQANTSGVVAWIGREYQSYVCDASLSFGTEKDVKIGTAGEEGTFRVVGLATQAGMRQMVRVA